MQFIWKLVYISKSVPTTMALQISLRSIHRSWKSETLHKTGQKIKDHNLRSLEKKKKLFRHLKLNIIKQI